MGLSILSLEYPYTYNNIYSIILFIYEKDVLSLLRIFAYHESKMKVGLSERDATRRKVKGHVEWHPPRRRRR